MITKILRLIECIPPVTHNSRPRLSGQAAATPLILRLKKLMLKTSPLAPQNPLQPVFIKQEEFVFGERSHRNHLPR
ncbi:MAG: hypothetical protein EBS96_10800 [Spartobacteria bacterium]|nr:hypothetical protein [Spartobacteria bacterium]